MSAQEIAAALQRVEAVEPARLRTLVEESYGCSPVSTAVRNAVPVDLRIEVGAS